MVSRSNYLLVRAFLTHYADVLQHDPLTVQNYRGWLKHVLRWAAETPFGKASAIRPTFPRYLLTVRRSNGKPLSPAGIRQICRGTRGFFVWLRQTNPMLGRALPEDWLATLQPPAMAEPLPAERQVVTLEMVRVLLRVPAAQDDLRTKRDQAAAAFLFLSGARASAFVTLTLDCVDIAARTVRQDPTLGVHTKNKKAAITRLLEIPDLLAVVAEWDALVRSELPGTTCWYTPLHSFLGSTTLAGAPPGRFRKGQLAASLSRLFQKANLPPLSPHKFRHGHAVYGLKLAQDMSDLKAISMNLMHASLAVTDRTYAVLSDRDVHERIARLGRRPSTVASSGDANALKEALQEVLVRFG
jgi:integrase